MTRGSLAAAVVMASAAAAAVEVPLGDLDLGHMTSGWGRPLVNRNVRGDPLRCGGRTFAQGVGTHADSLLRVRLPDGPARFRATVGVDDAAGAGKGSVEFRILAGDELLWSSGVLRGGMAPVTVELDLSGRRDILLRAADGGDGTTDDLANWGEAVFVLDRGRPEALPPVPDEEPEIVTPPPSPAPRINGARAVGARPGRPFQFTLAVSGDPPPRLLVEGLPEGLRFDTARGWIVGVTPAPGNYDVAILASNVHGQARGRLRIVIGEALALTPPMGWNSWNCFGPEITQERIAAAAVAMVTQGLVRHGWTYINIDDAWQRKSDEADPAAAGPVRDARGRILPNRRFPDMAGLVRQIHALGLKAGIYSSPGPLTCAGFEGSYGHEAADADQYTAWGFDYLKYDWCAYSRVARGSTLPEQMKPYLHMARELRRQPRDIVFSLCQYGVGNVSAWGRTAGGHLWRTTGDIEDTWASVRRIAAAQAGLELFAGPGGWNDPDMLVIGRVGWGHPRPTRLTPNEQYSHLSLWCLLAAPLLLGCDLEQLDAFTLNLVTNDEILEINQDPLGRQASRVAVRGPVQVWAKPMEDGSVAVGLFNFDEEPVAARLEWRDIGLRGRWRLRDAWRQRDLGVADGAWETRLPRHGCAVLRLRPESGAAGGPACPPSTWEADVRDRAGGPAPR